MKRSMKTIMITAFSAIVLLLAASCTTMGAASTQSNSTMVSVSGTGIVYLKADMVTFSINVNELAPTTAEAQQAANKKMTMIFDILKKHNIADDDISTTALNFNSEYYWDNGRQIKTGESVSQTVYVTMREIADFPVLADDLGTALSGISFYNVRFDSSLKATANTKARELAYEDALQKAELYAKSAGLTVVKPVSISEGYSSYTNATYRMEDAKVMAAAAPEPSYGTQAPSGLLSSSIDVSITFELK
ncbi:MAG: SIMPL domain-containing protein [Spirochaetales bacterium]|nr:SIMPL domain-containing protein [Spirochaetales bacterium]